jgi:competence protein ComEC
MRLAEPRRALGKGRGECPARRGAWGPRLLDPPERFLGEAGFDRAPWLAVVFARGITAWFALPEMGHWCSSVTGCGLLALGALVVGGVVVVLALARVMRWVQRRRAAH